MKTLGFNDAIDGPDHDERRGEYSSSEDLRVFFFPPRQLHLAIFFFFRLLLLTAKDARGE